MANIIGFDPHDTASAQGAGWTVRERAELTELRFAMDAQLPALEWDDGTTDTGDPWMVAIDMRTDDLALHVARIGRDYVLLDGQLAPMAAGRSLRGVLETAAEAARAAGLMPQDSARPGRAGQATPALMGQGPEGMPVAMGSEAAPRQATPPALLAADARAETDAPAQRNSDAHHATIADAEEGHAAVSVLEHEPEAERMAAPISAALVTRPDADTEPAQSAPSLSTAPDPGPLLRAAADAVERAPMGEAADRPVPPQPSAEVLVLPIQARALDGAELRLGEARGQILSFREALERGSQDRAPASDTTDNPAAPEAGPDTAPPFEVESFVARVTLFGIPALGQTGGTSGVAWLDLLARFDTGAEASPEIEAFVFESALNRPDDEGEELWFDPGAAQTTAAENLDPLDEPVLIGARGGDLSDSLLIEDSLALFG